MRMAIVVGLLAVTGNARAQLPRLTPLVEFGCESCDGPLLFTRIEALTIAPDGRVVVLDRTAPHVRIFDATGRVQGAFARTGQGPGELETPMAISVAPDGNVEVVDMTRRRLIRYGPAGEDRGSVALGGFSNIGAFAPQGGHAIAAITAPGAPVLKLLRVTGDEAKEILQVSDMDFPQRIAGHIETLSVAVAPDGSFAVGDGAGAYLIRRYDADGRPAGEFARTIAKIRRTPEDIRTETERRSRMMAAMRSGRSAGSMSPPRIPEERNYFDPYALRFDEKGRLWVRVERGKREQTLFDVFDPRGTYLGEVIVPAAVREYALGAGLLAGVVADDLGVQRVRVWSVVDGELRK